jgi:hypothetical protein
MSMTVSMLSSSGSENSESCLAIAQAQIFLQHLLFAVRAAIAPVSGSWTPPSPVSLAETSDELRICCFLALSHLGRTTHWLYYSFYPASALLLLFLLNAPILSVATILYMIDPVPAYQHIRYG